MKVGLMFTLPVMLTQTSAMDKAAEDVGRQLGLMQRYLDTLPEKMLSLGIRSVLALIVFVIGNHLISVFRRLIRRALQKSSVTKEAEQFLDSALRALMYVVLVFIILGLFGVDAASVASVIASVGVTIGLAIQGSLTNCIGGILILILKPFKVGDYIIEDTHKNEGTVQEISIFYTKLTTFDNKVVLIPNGTLANSSLTNVTDESMRRVDLRVGISYDSDIRQARAVILELGRKNPLIVSDREFSVNVEELGESSVVLFIRFWAKKEDYWAVRFEMLENIKYAFDEAGIQIPYNQLDVHIKERE